MLFGTCLANYMLLSSNWTGLETSSSGINPMRDTHNYYVYENQRWNPLTGYTSHGLPTDRYMWSDVTGKHKRTREKTKLLSMHWQWVRDLAGLGKHTNGKMSGTRDTWLEQEMVAEFGKKTSEGESAWEVYI
jgi:hypothetical protein